MARISMQGPFGKVPWVITPKTLWKFTKSKAPHPYVQAALALWNPTRLDPGTFNPDDEPIGGSGAAGAGAGSSGGIWDFDPFDPLKNIDPLILDLNGNGIQTTSSSATSFD